MKINLLNNIINETLSNEIKKRILEESSKQDYYHVTLEGEPIETFSSKEDAEQYVMDNKEKFNNKKLLIDKKPYSSYEEMIDTLDEMGESYEIKEKNMKKKMNENMDRYHKYPESEMQEEDYIDEDALYNEDMYNMPEETISMDEYDENMSEMQPQYGDSHMEEELYELDLDEYGSTDEGATHMCNECGSMLNEEGTCDECSGGMYESKGVCQECGSMMNEEGMCSECGMKEEAHDFDMNEEDEEIREDDPSSYGDWPLDSFGDEEIRGMDYRNKGGYGFKFFPNEPMPKDLDEPYDLNVEDKPRHSKYSHEFELAESKKKKLILKESELIHLIKKMVQESIPGKLTAEKSRAGSKKVNDQHYSEVDKKMKNYLKFEGNDNPEFPHQVGKSVKKEARTNTPKQNDEVDKNYAGLESLKYDTEPSENFKKRLKMAIEGDSSMGNAVYTEKPKSSSSNGAKKPKTAEEKSGNQMKSTKENLEKIKNRSERPDKKDRVIYKKEKVPVDTKNKKDINESKNIINESIKNDIERMKNLYNYNKTIK